MRRRFFPQLDGIRGLAALIVVAHHFWAGSVRWDHTRGRIGVDIFFVLSGYLITRTLLLARASLPDDPWAILRRFHGRRFLRIIPVFYGTLTIAWLLHWEKPSANILWHYAFLSNFLFIRLGAITEAGGHLWALAVEQQYYLFWPIVVLAVPRKYLTKACLAMIAVGTFYRFLAGISGWSSLTIDFMTPGSFETLGMGALLAAWMENREEKPERVGRWMTGMILSGVLLMLLSSVTGSETFHRWVILFGTELSRAFVLTWLIGQAVWGIPGIIGQFLESPPARAIGRWSYSIYLSHNFFYAAFWNWPARAWLAFAATMVWSAAVYTFIEKRLALGSRASVPRPEGSRLS